MNKLFRLLCMVVFPIVFSCSKNNDIISQPTLNEVSPLKGAYPNQVTIRGKGFGSLADLVKVNFGISIAKIIKITDTLLVVEVPITGTSGPIEININGKYVKSTSSFTVFPGFWLQIKESIDPGFEARRELIAFSFGLKGYCGLGFNGVRSFNDLWQFDYNEYTWKQIKSCPVDRYGATAMVSNGKAYVVGGRSSNDSAHNSKQVWSYDPDIDVWERKKDFPGTARHSAVGVSVGGQICYFGTGEDDNGNILRDWWKYIPWSDFWVQKTDVPEATLTAAPAFVFNAKVYTGIGSYAKTKSWYCYDPALNTWKRLSDFPGSIVFGASAFVLQQTVKGYVCGGGDECWAYDVNYNTWTQQGFFADREAGATFMILDNPYFVGGSFTKKDLWGFIPAK